MLIVPRICWAKKSYEQRGRGSKKRQTAHNSQTGVCLRHTCVKKKTQTARLTGLPQHCAKEELSLDITAWTAELILLLLGETGTSFTGLCFLPLICPEGGDGRTDGWTEMCPCSAVSLLETFTLKMNDSDK